MNIYNNIKEVQDVGQIQPNSIINADCLEAMKYIADKSVNMILCDLPYQITACKWDTIIPFNRHIIVTKKRGKEVVMYKDEWVYNELKTTQKNIHQCEEEFEEQAKDGLWQSYNRVIKDNGAIVLTASQPFTSALAMSNIKMFKYEWIWNKKRITSPMLAKKQPLRQHENILVFYKNQCLYNPQPTTKNTSKSFSKKEMTDGKGEVWGGMKRNGTRNENEIGYPKSILNEIPVITNMSKEKFLHPTQKPVALFEYLIKTYTNEGDIVLDNCAGSFTTAIACLNTNRDYICIEKDEKYFEIGKNRIEEHIKIKEEV